MNKFSPYSHLARFLSKRSAFKVLVCSSLMFIASYVIATTGVTTDSQDQSNTTQVTSDKIQTLIVAGGLKNTPVLLMSYQVIPEALPKTQTTKKSLIKTLDTMKPQKSRLMQIKPLQRN